MAGVLYDANNVVVGHAVLYLAPWVAGQTPTPLVADTVPVFTPASWPSPWFTTGATNEGFKINAETSTTTVMIEEQSTPVGETVEGKTITIEAALAEDTLESMRLSWGGGVITTTAAGTGQPAKRTMTLTDAVNYYTACLEMRTNKGFPRRIYLEKTSITGSGEVSFRRAADKRTYPFRVATLCRPEQVQIVEITAVATA